MLAQLFSLVVIFLLALVGATPFVDPGPSIASAYALSTSTSLPFPSATLNASGAESFLVSSSWGLHRGQVQNGANRLAFVTDPFPGSSNTSDPSTLGPVLRVAYPAGSFGNGTGGAQFYARWNASGSASFLSAALSYEVAFEKNFSWKKGGKLPGLRGGPQPTRCSGGNQPNASDQCFSARVMWREHADGEIYAYIPTKNGICDDPDVDCNNDFGTSIGRGKFAFAAADWKLVTLFVRLNDPPKKANGYMAL
jgi:hypothetical protein